MALTSAERQARYRARQADPTRHGGQGRKRLSGHISAVAAFQLGRLAAYYGISKEAALDRIISEAEASLMLKLGSSSEAWKGYEKGRLREDGTVVK